MFIQSVVPAAAEHGLASCVQEAWAKVRNSLHCHFKLSLNDVIYCGIALGYADRSRAINGFRSEREAVAGFATFQGFAA